jgi:hypothetical protein
MNPTHSPSISLLTRRPQHGAGQHLQQPWRASSRHARPPRAGHSALARYTDRFGNPREVVVRRGLAGSALVVDRDAVSLGDCLLVAHLSADEPAENAAVVCASYLEDVRARSLRCRGLTARDARIPPLAEEVEPSLGVEQSIGEIEPIDSLGCTYRLQATPAGISIPALRWLRSAPSSEAQPVSLRETIAGLEAYEPMCTLTERALRAHRDDTDLSTSLLAAELTRVRESPIVLNRRLREVVLARVARGELSMSEIAVRCSRIKRDSKGNASGETSWLARRLGLLAESGQRAPTPWIHTDVLALIARRGLALSPREVELQ